MSSSRLLFHARSLAQFIPALFSAGLVSGEGGPKAAALTPALLARYRFTTARELEQAYYACPDRVALIDDDGALTYRQLRDDAVTFARYLTSLHLDRIRLGVMARNGRGIVTPLGAKGYCGGDIFLLNVGSSPEQLMGCIAETGINAVVIDSEFLDRLPEDLDIPVVVAHGGEPSLPAHDADLSTGRRSESAYEPHKTEPYDTPLRETLAGIVTHPEGFAGTTHPLFPSHGDIVLMSSGTSGIPKGIVRPEPKLPVVLASIVGIMPWKADQKVQMTASMFHTWGWACLNVALAARNTIVTRRNFDAEAALDDIERYQLDGLLSSPVFFKRMAEVDPEGRYDTSSLQFIASAGHALTPEIVHQTIDRFGPILANIYGSTELTLAATASAEEIAADPTVAGHIATGTRLEILDPEGNEVPTGQIGEIYLTNSTALTGYTNPALKVEKVRGMVSIGDMGYLDDAGRLHVKGRADDMIIVGGENVHPQSVTEVLETMPGVADVYSGGVEDPDTFHRVAVWIVPADGAALTADAVREYVRDNLADHSVPRDVHFRDRLPRNATGKVVPRLL